MKKPALHKIRNVGRAICLSKLEIMGVAAEPGRPGQKVKIWTRHSLTSEARTFHIVASSLRDAITHAAQADGRSIDLERHSTIFIVRKKNNSAKIWLDKAAKAIRVIPKINIVAMQPIFEDQIADINGMDFPAVKIEATDSVI